MSGIIESIWRYPVKSMRGEEVKDIFVSFAGLMGDRVYAISSTSAGQEFPWHTSREQEDLLLCEPAYRDSAQLTKPPAAEASLSQAVPLNPAYPDAQAFSVDIKMPDGAKVDINDPKFLDLIREHTEGEVKVHYSQRSMTDCRPISLMSLQTLNQLSAELGMELDKARFRENFYVDWSDEDGYFEDTLVGKTIKIGDQVELMVLERDPRCKMITIDPETAETDRRILRHVTKEHGGFAGIYAAVLKEGIVRAGDKIEIVG